jgi:hypothetical protein
VTPPPGPATAALADPTATAESEPVLPWVLDHLARHYVYRDALAADLRARARLGIERYGVPLTTHNGRRPRVDAYQEACDLVMYAAQDHLEAPSNETAVTLQMAVQLAERLRRALGGEVR